MDTMFANPGSTEIPLLCRPAAPIRFVLGLHEASVIGTATGYALASERPALALLHTTAGFGNAVGAIATARVNRAPLVVLVGQQDRRHLAQRPFLAGDLDGLAGDYPVWSTQPVRPGDVPGAVDRAWHEARRRRGPAVVIVPMDDWDAPAGPLVSARTSLAVAAADPGGVGRLAEMIDGSSAPAVVVGADADSEAAWAATVALAERLGAPVWQEAFGARAGFPQDHPLFAGHLPAGRDRLRRVLAPHDLVVVIGAPAFRQYPYEDGPLVEPATRLAMVVDDPDLAHHSPVDLALVGPIAAICSALAQTVGARPAPPPAGPPVSAPPRPDPAPAPLSAPAPNSTGPARPPAPLSAPAAPALDATDATDALDGVGPGGGLRPRQVFAALAARIDPDTIVVEETPSSRPDLHRLLPARRPLGFLSAAMGGLGFALPAAVGLRLARPDRPVVAVVGDGSSLYAIQALWTAAHYGVGVLFVVLANGRYAVMDRLAEGRGHRGPWPAFPEVAVADLARGLGCPAQQICSPAELTAALDAVVPALRHATAPLLLEVTTTDEDYFNP
ncbi:MAG: thiamine pyrophosphate-binding protein [Acidobacteriota bacterium]|nr:thiamine pyrophosphate-binding protein [Acidobacteriota bacterium]